MLISRVKFLLPLVLVTAQPCALLAQRGPGGARIGGGTVATGMDNNGQPTGINTKDDLRGFHDVLAVQATKEQAAAFAAMMKNTSAAAADLKTLQEQLQKQNDPPALRVRVLLHNVHHDGIARAARLRIDPKVH